MIATIITCVPFLLSSGFFIYAAEQQFKAQKSYIEAMRNYNEASESLYKTRKQYQDLINGLNR